MNTRFAKRALLSLVTLALVLAPWGFVPTARAQSGKFTFYPFGTATGASVTYSAATNTSKAQNLTQIPASAVLAFLNVTASTGTNPTLSVVVQDGPTQTGPWSTYITFVQVTAATNNQVIQANRVPGNWLQVVATIGGSASPTVSFSMQIVAYTGTPVTVTSTTSGVLNGNPVTIGPTAFGSQAQFVINEENLTLSTSGLTTQTTGLLLPANSLILSVDAIVTTTITTTTNWQLGDATTNGRFSAVNATLTAGTQQIGILQWSGAVTTLAAGPSQAAAAKVQVTCTGSNPGAGAIRISVKALVFSAPTS